MSLWDVIPGLMMEFAVDINSYQQQQENDSQYKLTDNVTAETPPDTGQSRSLAHTLWVFAGPVIFFIGICGNILILLVMSKKRMRGTTTSLYLRFMAVTDICVLILGMIPEWLEAAEYVVFKELHPATCKFEKFSFYTCGDIAIWILVVFTIDRFIAVCFPLDKKDYCQPSRAKYYALAVISLAVVKNFHVFWTRGPVYDTIGNETVLYKNCGRAAAHFEFYIRPWIVFTLVNAIPFLIILICNVFIIRALVIVKKLRSEQAIVSNSDRQLVQMSLMCLSASFCFLICITPSIILLVGKPFWSGPAYDISKAINNQLVYVNHSINFFLYCITGKRFRRVLILMLTRSDTGSPSGSNDSQFRTTVYRTSLPTAKINNKNSTLTGSKQSNLVANPRRTTGDRSASRTPETSPFLVKKNLATDKDENESNL